MENKNQLSEDDKEVGKPLPPDPGGDSSFPFFKIPMTANILNQQLLVNITTKWRCPASEVFCDALYGNSIQHFTKVGTNDR